MSISTEENKKRIVDFLLSRGILVSEDLLESLKKENELEKLFPQCEKGKDMLILNRDLMNAMNARGQDLNFKELEKSMFLAEKRNDKKMYENFISIISQQKDAEAGAEKAVSTEEYADGQGSVKIVFSYSEEPKKREIQDFVMYFNSRFSAIEKILHGRQELQNLTSIARVKGKKDRESISVIGIVYKKDYTKNMNIMLTLEDPTGSIKVLVNKNKPEFYDAAKDIVLDEVIGVTGVSGENIIFANNITWPDIAIKEIKKCEDDAYAIFLSDIHVGSNCFLSGEFCKFLKWIRGEAGNEQQKAIASKVKYIFIIGDLVDGVGIYPGQERELLIDDINRQYSECARLLGMIPQRIKIVLCPGNHDAMRIAEPQPELYKDLAKPIWDLKNVIMVTNPAVVNIHSSNEFAGFDVLMYHGYSFDFYAANVDSIRNGGGYDRADLIMKFLLQRRHLAPTHESSVYIPDQKKDSLVIDRAPDFFATGHIHKTSVENYRNTTMICGSCWQPQTPFQEKVGHHPEPCRVPIVSLKTRNVKILNFS